MISKVLVANRGEIAIRVLRACKELGIKTVAIYSEPDRYSLHVRYADEAYLVGPAASQQSYLRIDKIINIAKQSGAEAIHPGYGFLAENSVFAEACQKEGIIFIGPPSSSLRAMGDKTIARQTMLAANVPIIPGMQHGLEDETTAYKSAQELGYPIMIKAAAGGGGKGMRIVHNEQELTKSLRAARNEAQGAFGDPTVYLEKFIEHPRHIEFQILADNYGNVVHLGERECSIQRRHQKLIEESPSCAIDSKLREKMGDTAVRVAKVAGYTNAGTVEFLLDKEGNFYFLEMNTRLQVEHPVTELVTCIDIVKEQLHIAAGERLSFTQQDITFSGAAIECRISAEDPENNFFPSSGKITHLHEPGGPGVRVESGLFEGLEISLYYDPLIAKLIVWAKTRDEAIQRMRRALSEYRILGIKTTIPFHIKVMENHGFITGKYDTGFIEKESVEKLLDVQKRTNQETVAIAAAVIAYTASQHSTLKFSTQPVSKESPWKLAGRWETMRKRY